MNNLTIKNGFVVNRESTKLEFKESFSRNVKSYIRSICAFANNSGGCIVFGVKDKPKEPIGLGNKSKDFRDYDGKFLEVELQNTLSTKVEFKFTEFAQVINDEEVEFGVLKIEESLIKPVICKQNDGNAKLRAGAIYFRYHSQTEEIKAQDLMSLIQREKDKEKELWIKHITKISQVGVSNIGVFSYDGEMYAGDKKIIIDKDTLDKIKFIKEGQFVEKNGAPALILKGEIKNLNTLEILERNTNPNISHPYEGIGSVAEAIQKITGIKEKIIPVESGSKRKKFGKFFVGEKSYSITYLLSKIKEKEGVESEESLFWSSEKGNIKKYSQKFILLCEQYFKEPSKFLDLID